MPYKNPEDQKAYHRKWYERNSERIKKKSKVSNKKYKERNAQFVRNIKSSNPCTDCSDYFHYTAMDFDHISEDKDENVSRLVNDGISLKRIEKEINKCELVCSNCHRVRTWKRANNMRL